MNSRIPRHKSGLLALTEKQEKFVTPTREGTKEELIELQKGINSIINMLDNEKAKPFSSEYIEILKNNPYCSLFKKALVSVIYDKVKNILDKNKNKFKINFETYIENYSVCICGVVNNMKFSAIYLDICEDTPRLESIIYDKNVLQQEKDNIDNNIINYGKDKEEVKTKINLENDKLEEMLKDPHNSLPIPRAQLLANIDEYDNRVLDNLDSKLITPSALQSFKLEDLNKRLENINSMLASFSIERDKYIKLLEVINTIDFNDFEILRKIVEKELGIITSKKNYRYVTHGFIDNSLIGQETYDIGYSAYTLRYTKKTKIPGKGVL